ncbi:MULTISPECIES: UPF0158 family protein [unclassified Mycobacterium]|uniref:UPF0158 family protein n=1 Tax=unclassified Mycobacterium TaxID=2642494 RepID=UPI0029C8C579|nr:MULTISPECIES: UPF0158 family protein [unclassified Mycobacterium]
MRRWDREAVGQLRGAVYRGDGSVVEVVRGRLTVDVLQMAGDGLRDAVAQGVDGAVDLATQCAAALRARSWVGDDELADQLEAALGLSATPLLRPLPVDVEELASFLEGDPLYGEARIELKSGQIWPPHDDIDEDDVDDVEDSWLYIHHQGSHDAYRDMERFIATVTDPEIADRLEIAIAGKGAFRRFKDVLSRWPEELERYVRLRDERQRGRARAWLAAEGYRPAGTARS